MELLSVVIAHHRTLNMIVNQEQNDISAIFENMKRSFDEDLSELKATLLQYEPITCIALLFYHFINLNKASANNAGFTSCAPLELIQALILKNGYESFSTTLPDKSAIKRIFDLAFKLCATFGYTNAGNDRHSHSLLISARNHTSLVRGEAYPFQREQYLQDVLSLISTKAELGLELLEIIDVLRGKMTNAFSQKIREAFDPMKNKAEITLLEHINSVTFTLEELVSLFGHNFNVNDVKLLLDKISLSFGELNSNDEQHLFLDNPVQMKPIVRIDDEHYFAGHLTIMFINSRKIIENILCSDNNLKKQYREVVRPKYLENKLSSILEQSFPNGIHLRNYPFYKDGGQYENDHTVVIGDKAVIFEAKASKFKDSVYRGSDDAFKEAYKKNIIAASIQANRFEEFLRAQNDGITINSEDEAIHIDTEQIKEYIKFNIILDTFPMPFLDRKNLSEYAQ